MTTKVRVKDTSVIVEMGFRILKIVSGIKSEACIVVTHILGILTGVLAII